MSASTLTMDAAVESIARSLTSVISSATTENNMSNECMRLMGAREESELFRSLKGAVSAILAKKPSPPNTESATAEEEPDVIAGSMLNGRRVYPRSPLDKLLDSMVDEMLSNASKNNPS